MSQKSIRKALIQCTDLELLWRDFNALEGVMHCKSLAYISFDQHPNSLSDADAKIFMRALNSPDKPNLVLHSYGGSINAARKIGLLLQDQLGGFKIYVPYTAISAATIVCLAAQEIIMGQCAELSPIDPQLHSFIADQSAPVKVSPQDVKAYRAVLREWFDVDPEADRMQLVNLITRHIPPASLGSFYRAEQHTRILCDELMQLNYPNAKLRKKIIAQLLEGYQTHDTAIFRNEADTLGLRVSQTAKPLDLTLKNLIDQVQYILRRSNELLRDQSLGRVSAAILCDSFIGLYFLEAPRRNDQSIDEIANFSGMWIMFETGSSA